MIGLPDPFGKGGLTYGTKQMSKSNSKQRADRKRQEREGQTKPPTQGTRSITWSHPGIVGPVAAAMTAGVFAIVLQLMNDDTSPDTTAVNQETTVSPDIDIENRPENVFKPRVTIGLDEEGVGNQVGKAVDPLREDTAAIRTGIDSLSDQLSSLMATAELSPKQPPSESKDPLEVKAVEFYNAGVDAHKAGEIGRAIGHYLDAVSLDPDFAAAHNNLGVALYAKGDLDGAIGHYKEALRIDTDDANAHNNLGVALYAKGDLDGAIGHYNEALRIDPESAKYHDNLALALALMKETPMAVEALTRAIELDGRYRAWARTDKQYDGIRDDPAFRKLVYGD